MKNDQQNKLQNSHTTIARQNFALFMDNLPGFAWMKDIEGRYVYANRQVTLEMAPFRGDWFQKTDAELWPHPIAMEYVANDRTVIDTRCTLQIVEKYMRSGTQCYALVTKFPILDEQGNIIMIGGTSVDVTELKRVEDLLAARVHQQNAIVHLGQYALTGASISDLLDATVRITAGTIQVDYCSVLERLPGESRAVFRANYGWTPKFPDKAGAAGSARSPGEYALSCNQTVVFDNLQHETRFKVPAPYRDHGIVAGVAVPITGRHQPYGVLYALSAAERRFTTDDVSFLESITNILTTAIQRRALEMEVVEIAEREQRRIGEDLHDGVCQDLISAGLFAKSLQQKLAAKSLSESDEAAEFIRIACGAAGHIREIVRGLIPPDMTGEGFIEVLRAWTNGIGRRSPIVCRCRIRNSIDISSNLVAYHLFRIAQEAVNNAIKHSKAKHVWIALGLAHGNIKLTIKDDGIGFVPKTATKGMGLHIMRYRASSIDAILSIECPPAGGTIVSCALENSGRHRSVHQSRARAS